jgi:hypothetical protein
MVDIMTTGYGRVIEVNLGSSSSSAAAAAAVVAQDAA